MRKWLILILGLVSVVGITSGCTKQITSNPTTVQTTPQSVERVEAEILDVENYVRTEAKIEVGFSIKDKYYIATINDNDLLDYVRNNKSGKIIVYVQIIGGKYEAVSWKEK